MTAPKGEPILIDCEGAGSPGNDISWHHELALRVKSCQMCGQTFLAHRLEVIPPHKRDDIIARTKRRDFG